MDRDKPCKDRVNQEWQDRRADLKILFETEDNETEELGSLYDYGLCINRVESGTFEGQREAYIRYQFSWGGPSDELRIYENGEIEYWFLDWFDGASLGEYWFLDWFDGASLDVTNDAIAIQAAEFAKQGVV